MYCSKVKLYLNDNFPTELETHDKKPDIKSDKSCKKNVIYTNGLSCDIFFGFQSSFLLGFFSFPIYLSLFALSLFALSLKITQIIE